MNNAELADELALSVKDAEQYGYRNIVLKNVDANRIIAALRRQPSNWDIPLCAGHADWWFTSRNHLKGDISCVVCAFNPERQPSSDKVLVPREPTDEISYPIKTTESEDGDDVFIMDSLGRILCADEIVCALNARHLAMVFVPKEPTEEIICAIADNFYEKTQFTTRQTIINGYRAMLAASEGHHE